VSGQLAVAVALILAALAVAAVALIARQALISRRGGVVECALRRDLAAPWHHGLAEYQRDQLSWHRSLSFRLRADAVFDRAGLRILRTRRPAAAEAPRLGPGMIIAECASQAGPSAGAASSSQGPVELAMSEAALTGLLAWLESSPVFYLRAC
jgi:Protein of unknown function (DUF2550)